MTISPVAAELFSQRIATRDARVGIVGSGLRRPAPSRLAFAETGFDVVGIDIDDDRVPSRQRVAAPYLVDVPEKRYAAADGRLRATTDFAAVAEARRRSRSACRPRCRKTRAPDCRVHHQGGREASRGTCGQSSSSSCSPTTYPGTTEEVIRADARARCGCASAVTSTSGAPPERVDPGNATSPPAAAPRRSSRASRPECLARTRELVTRRWSTKPRPG